MKNIEIKHRFTNAVLFTAEAEDADEFPIRSAVVKAIGSGADLRGAYLRDAYLRGANLRDAYLGGANLRDADLGGADLGGADLRDAYLRGANLRDAYLGGANLRDADLGGADLGGADLGGAYLRGANLGGAYLRGANLSGADLGGAYLGDAYLRGANLSGANLRGANLRGANNVVELTAEEQEQMRVKHMLAFRERHPDVPVIENLDAKILAAVSAEGCRLDMSIWHGCETTHCRAGWAIHLAGAAGYELERKSSPEFAGLQIYRASTGRVPDFYADNDVALADIRACAKRERAKAAVQP